MFNVNRFSNLYSIRNNIRCFTQNNKMENVHNLKDVSQSLKILARDMYKGRDVSHGIGHAIKVRNNAMRISNSLNIKDLNVLLKIEAAALFHDVWDHKYVVPGTINYENIKNKFYVSLRDMYFSDHDIKDIEIIINNVSLSREMEIRERENEMNLRHLQFMRDIVSDADKLEMLGFQGINRIVEFQKHKYPETRSKELKNVVKDIFYSKISKLIDDNYIRTEPARIMAKPLMKEMNTYIRMLK